MKKKVHQKGVYPVIFEVMKMSKLSGVKYLTNFYLHTNPPPPLPPSPTEYSSTYEGFRPIVG